MNRLDHPNTRLAHSVTRALGLAIVALLIAPAPTVGQPERQLDKLRLPAGFSISVFAEGVTNARSLAMSGGEDYELCFVSPPDVTGRRADEFRERFGIGLTRVGQVEEGTGVEILGAGGGQDSITAGFDHFSSSGTSC